MKAIIIGGGIGGLTTALMLHTRHIECELYEQTDTIRELGVGINTLPHAIKELADLGLLERLDAVGIRTYELIYTNRSGQEVWREPRGPMPDMNTRSSQSIAGVFRAPSTTPCARGSANRAFTPAIGWARSPRMMAASPPISLIATPRTARRRAATFSSARAAFTPPCAKRSIRMKVPGAGTGPCSGAAPSSGRNS